MMNWHILGIQPTTDIRAIKKAYATKLKTTRPDEKPKEYQALRAAYDELIKWAEQQQKQKQHIDIPETEQYQKQNQQTDIPAVIVDKTDTTIEPIAEFPTPDETLPTSIEIFNIENQENGWIDNSKEDILTAEKHDEASLYTLLTQQETLFHQHGVKGLIKNWVQTRQALDSLPLHLSENASWQFWQFIEQHHIDDARYMQMLNQYFSWANDYQHAPWLEAEQILFLNECAEKVFVPIEALEDIDKFKKLSFFKKLLNTTFLYPELEQLQKKYPDIKNIFMLNMKNAIIAILSRGLLSNVLTIAKFIYISFFYLFIIFAAIDSLHFAFKLGGNLFSLSIMKWFMLTHITMFLFRKIHHFIKAIKEMRLKNKVNKQNNIASIIYFDTVVFFVIITLLVLTFVFSMIIQTDNSQNIFDILPEVKNIPINEILIILCVVYISPCYLLYNFNYFTIATLPLILVIMSYENLEESYIIIVGLLWFVINHIIAFKTNWLTKIKKSIFNNLLPATLLQVVLLPFSFFLSIIIGSLLSPALLIDLLFRNKKLTIINTILQSFLIFSLLTKNELTLWLIIPIAIGLALIVQGIKQQLIKHSGLSALLSIGKTPNIYV